MGKMIKGKFPAKQKKKSKPADKKTPAVAYQLKISLLYSEPLIWRRIQAPGSMTLAELHEVIQMVMGWTDTHLHQFMIGNNLYGPADLDDDWSEIQSLDEAGFKLDDLEADIRQRCIYEYDFGDGWQHEIKIEEVIPAEEEKINHPILLAGERACPPEDVGGIPGYENFLAVLADPEDEEHEAMRQWCGGNFDPDYFAMDEINKILKKIR